MEFRPKRVVSESLCCRRNPNIILWCTRCVFRAYWSLCNRVHSWIWITHTHDASFTCPPHRRVGLLVWFLGHFHPFAIKGLPRARNIDDAIIFPSKRVLFDIFDTFVETDGACRLHFAQRFNGTSRRRVHIQMYNIMCIRIYTFDT